MTKLQRALVELVKEGRTFANIVKAVGVDPKEIEVAVQLALNGVK